MSFIDISVLKEAFTYCPETGRLTWLHRPLHHFFDERAQKICNTQFAGTPALDRVSGHGYRTGTLMGRKISAHRAILAMQIGRWPTEVDHINGDRTDNRVSNLREVTRLENRRNQRRPKNNKSGRVGVAWSHQSGSWQAYIRVDRKMIHLGLHSDLADAIAARADAERRHGFHANHGREAA